MSKKDILKYALLILSIIALSIGLLVYTLLPELSDFRNSIYGHLVYVFIMTSVILYLTLSKRIGMPLIGKITVLIYLFLYALFSIIDLGKIKALFFFIYSIYNIISTICIYKKTGKEYKSIWLFGAFSYLTTIIFVLRVEYINGEFNLTFLIPAIIVAVVAFVPTLVYWLVRHTIHKDLENLICIPLLALFGGFGLTWLTLGSMNVYLDMSKPTYEEYVIIDKDIRTGARQITTYEFKVIDGEKSFTIGVSEEVYYDCEINDTITLSIYKGAFNEPYYIHDKQKE